MNESVKEDGRCVGIVKHLLIGDMFRPRDAQHSSIAPSFKKRLSHSALT